MKPQIAAIDCFSRHMPFRQSFTHSSATRHRADSIFVRVRHESGITGIGEGCPRHYVTGETMSGAARFIRSTGNAVRELVDVGALKGFVSAHRDLIDTNPAAWCAMELALLDMVAKLGRVTVEDLLGQVWQRPDYQYSAVLGHSDARTFKNVFDRYRQLGLVDFKVKLSGNQVADHEKFELMHPYRQSIRVRTDANNLWPRADLAAKYLGKIDGDICQVEEPLSAGDLDGLECLYDKTGIGVVLDESLLRIDQVPKLGRRWEIWTANIRVSKMGGVIRSLAMIEELRDIGIPITVGAHVGESSLLTRAALILADAAGPALIAQEGAFGEYLLQSDPMNSLIQFGAGGRLDPSSMYWRNSPGFGLSFKE